MRGEMMEVNMLKSSFDGRMEKGEENNKPEGGVSNMQVELGWRIMWDPAHFGIEGSPAE